MEGYAGMNGTNVCVMHVMWHVLSRCLEANSLVYPRSNKLFRDVLGII